MHLSTYGVVTLKTAEAGVTS